MHLFYCPDIKSNTYTLSEEESKHCSKVLRLKVDEKIFLIDGKGGYYTAKIIDIQPKRTVVNIIATEKEYKKRNYHLHIAIAPTKSNDRFEWFLEKATEIGVDEITPLLCEHSERKVIKTERLNKVLVSAMKQSGQAFLPKLNNLTTFTNLITNATETNKYIAHCYNSEKTNLNNEDTIDKNVLILIGPEGDFSSQEVEAAKNKGCKPISLGSTRLRTETAGIMACCSVSLLNLHT